MTVAPERRYMVENDPLYQEGMASLQAGEWEDALHSFEVLDGRYPNNQLILQALDEVRFKAKLDKETRVSAKRWNIPLRPILLRVVIVLVIAVIVVQGARLVDRYIAPTIARAQTDRRLAQLLVEANAYLESGGLDDAEAGYRELLLAVPGHTDALQGLEQVAVLRGILDLYNQAIRLQNEGEYEAAVSRLTEISVQSPGYRDVNARITAIRQQQELESLFAEAEELYASGQALDAVAKYEQIRGLSITFQSEIVIEHLFSLYLQLGSDLVQHDYTTRDDVSQAIVYFTEALALKPRNAQAALEQRLAKLYLEGQDKYYQNLWNDAIARLRIVYDQRPDYLKGTVVALLYDAYVRSGDQYQEAGDIYLAYDQYRKAVELPVQDKALASGRMFSIAPRLTPTATPTTTPTQTPIPTPPTPTPIPTPKPLLTYRNQIIFYSENEELPGFWVMDPSGQNRQYLGGSGDLRKQYDELIEQEQFSPDSRFRVFVRGMEPSPQLFIADAQYSDLPARQLTNYAEVSYDPVWSPDGSRIAFVSQVEGSDDIWVVYPNGTGMSRLTENTWEWDKHPSWSPDSTRIVFWSNRWGLKQIFIMDANGRDVKNISNTQWDEYDPIWIK